MSKVVTLEQAKERDLKDFVLGRLQEEVRGGGQVRVISGMVPRQRSLDAQQLNRPYWVNRKTTNTK